jgi:hypothetical protein
MALDERVLRDLRQWYERLAAQEKLLSKLDFSHYAA